MVDSTNACCIPYPTRYTTAHYDSKVIYNGVTYQHLVYDFGTCLIREEDNKVYVIGTSDSTERVMYDFNLGLNDTLRTFYTTDTFVSWVTSMDSTQLSGTWYKVWHFYGTHTFADSSNSYYYNVVEGIGCTNGVYYPAAPYDLYTYSDQLLCFSNDMGLTSGFSKPVASYGSGYSCAFDNLASCSSFRKDPMEALSTGQPLQKNSYSSVVPNPATENSRIILPYDIPSGNVMVLNQMGQAVINTSFQNKQEILLGDNIHTPGIYCYRVTDTKNGSTFSGRFLVR